jgi:kynureninase
MIDRPEAEALDLSDPLASFRDRFVIPDPGRIYLDGNSLGRLSIDVQRGIRNVVDDWGRRAVEGWHDWIELPTRLGDRLATTVLGAQPGEVLVADSVTVNLYKLAHAAADLRPGPIVTDAANFPTDRYALEGVARARGREYIEVDSVEEAVAAARDGVLCLSHVDYRSAALRDIVALTASTDALVIWDLSHSAGGVEVDLSVADLAVGCTYKYLNAGPGAPAFLYVRREIQDQLRSPIQGWFGRREQFAMGAGYEAADGIERFAAGTPSVIGLAAIDASVGLLEEAGVARIAAKGRSLTELAITLADEWRAPLGFEIGSPRDASVRGAHVALHHADAWQIARALIERGSVVPDFRPPDILRLGFSPLYTRHVDAWDALDRLRGIVERGEHRSIAAPPMRVT